MGAATEGRARAVACALGAVPVVASVATVAGLAGAPVTGAVLHLSAALALLWSTTSRLAHRITRHVALGALATSAAAMVLVGLTVAIGMDLLGHVGFTIADVVIAAAATILIVALGPIGRLVVDPSSTRTEALLGTGTLAWLGVVLVPLAGAVASGSGWDLRAASPVLIAVPLLFGLHVGLVVRERRAATHTSRYDRLTGLANRERFRDLIEHDLTDLDRTGRDLMVCSIGLHRFRVVNDNYGYAVGDELLRAVAARLVEVLPDEGTAARVDGTVFGISLPLDPDGEDADAVGQRLLAELTAPFRVIGTNHTVGASIGVAIGPRDGADREELLRAADLARQQAKRTGPSKVEHYHESLHAGAQLQHALETSLQLALEREELTLAYQPRIDRRSGDIVAVEALLRWRHPTLGNIPPSVFVPVAEDCGLIGRLGGYALRVATAQMARWRATGVLDVPVSVNVSAHQLRDPVGFRDTVVSTLEATGLPPERLELELTESALLPDAPDLAEALASLRRTGVRLSIDDFGTGYSALAYLTTLSIDGLKIDRSFVSTIGADGGPTPVIDAIIALGTSLGLFVVAEGVESEAQARYLRSHGCHELQGYLHGRPLPAEAIERAVRRSRSTRLDVGRSLRAVDEQDRSRPATATPPAASLQGALGWHTDAPWAAHQDPQAVTAALRALSAGRDRETTVAARAGTSTIVCDN